VDADQRIAAQLNSLTMVQGGNNSVFSQTYGISGYGCIALKTTVSLGVFMLVGFAGLILVITTFYWFYLPHTPRQACITWCFPSTPDGSAEPKARAG
jgi:hypothetical protein